MKEHTQKYVTESCRTATQYCEAYKRRIYFSRKATIALCILYKSALEITS